MKTNKILVMILGLVLIGMPAFAAELCGALSAEGMGSLSNGPTNGPIYYIKNDSGLNPVNPGTDAVKQQFSTFVGKNVCAQGFVPPFNAASVALTDE